MRFYLIQEEAKRMKEESQINTSESHDDNTRRETAYYNTRMCVCVCVCP